MPAYVLSDHSRMSMSPLYLCLLSALLSLCGCAQSPSRGLARIWKEYPKLTWTRVPEASNENKVVESKSAAKDSTDASPPYDPSIYSRFRKSAIAKQDKPKVAAQVAGVTKIKPGIGPLDPFLEEELTAKRTAPNARPVVQPERKSPPPQLASARDRLRKTLEEDTRRTVLPDVDAGEQEQLRLRIESLMSRASAHCEDDQWQAAKRAAELAQSLAESSGLDFDPDDELPIELLTFINSRIEADAEAVKQKLADAESAAEADADPARHTERVYSCAKPSAATGKKASPFEAVVPFDPYAQQVALAHLDEQHHEQLFGPSMVVLDSPSFEDEDAEVSPTAFSRTTDRIPTSKRRFALGRSNDRHLSADEQEEVETEDEKESSEGFAEDGEILEAPNGEDALDDEPTVNEIALPSPYDLETDVAPSPPVDDAGGPDLALPSDEDDELASLPEDQAADGDSEELRSAGAWPRWLPFSMLSLLTAAFCLWLWRRRVGTAA